MSLDVFLETAERNPLGQNGEPHIFIREDGQTKQISRGEWDRRFPGREPVTIEEDAEDFCVYTANITHNLGAMADAAGIYEFLWEPAKAEIEIAAQLVGPLTIGLERLRADPEKYRAFNPKNGWGNYEGLVRFVDDYLSACRAYPRATVRVWV